MKIIYSHPDKKLVDHLNEVAFNCRSVINKLQLPTAIKSELSEIAFLCGAFHDLGKATKYFQHYLLDEKHTIIGPKNHALISALFVKEVTKRYLQSTLLTDFEKELFSHFAFVAVKRHHGSLNNFDLELTKTEEKSKELKQQVVAFEEPETQEIVDHFLKDYSFTYSLEDFKEYIQKVIYAESFFDFNDEQIASGFFINLAPNQRISYYYIHQLLFSTLLLSDKSDVILGNFATEKHSEKAVFEKIEKYRSDKGFDEPSSKINELKNQAYFAAIEQIKKIVDANNHLYSLTLPTGLGKTITSFGVALALKELLGFVTQRIIVTIPYTSIIDQNFEVYREILSNPGSEVLLKHHHLADPEYKVSDDDVQKYKDNESAFLIETWQSEVVVTTFVQLLNSVFSNNKSLLMKLPNLANSIVILDEIQTIPYCHWTLIRETLTAIGKLYNCYFILMSATQPLIFEPEKEITEIIPDYKSYFKFFNRTKLINKFHSKISLEAFSGEVVDYAVDFPEKDILIILNTKKHSKKCFEQLRDCIDYDIDEIYYLSTLITPYERKIIIEEIKNRSSSKRKIIVSTQLIEAGVDVSVDTVFRAIAPLDSIIQAAGRANRYNEKTEQGEVYLYEIEEMERATMMIYGSDLILKTKNVLKNFEFVEESNYLQLIENYFIEVKKQALAVDGKYYKALLKLNFEDVGKFSFIEEEYKSESVFLQLNETAETVWNEYIAIYNRHDLDKFEKKAAFSRIKATFYEFVINVPVKWGEQTISFDSEKDEVFGFYLSTLKSPSSFYKYNADNFYENTGYQELTSLVL